MFSNRAEQLIEFKCLFFCQVVPWSYQNKTMRWTRPCIITFLSSRAHQAAPNPTLIRPYRSPTDSTAPRSPPAKSFLQRSLRKKKRKTTLRRMSLRRPDGRALKPSLKLIKSMQKVGCGVFLTLLHFIVL